MATIFDPSDALNQVRFPHLRELHKKAMGMFWPPDEVDMSADHADLAKLSPTEHHILIMICAFFAESDKLVNQNINANYMDNFLCDEAQMFFNYQISTEDIHTMTYTEILQTMVPDTEERRGVANHVGKYNTIQLKRDWMLSWQGSDAAPGEKLVAGVCAEGIFFCTSFAFIFYFGEKKYFPGTVFANKKISADEAMHCRFAAALYNTLPKEYLISQDRAHEIIRSAADTEKQFVDDIMAEDLPTLTKQQMRDYVEYTANVMCVMLGVEAIYPQHDACPIGYMANMGVDEKTNFFEERNGAYATLNGASGNSELKKFVRLEVF